MYRPGVVPAKPLAHPLELSFIPDLQGRLSLAYCLERIREVPALIRIRSSADCRQFEQIAKTEVRVIYAPRDEPWGMRSSMIADPEGNIIELQSWSKGESA